MNHFTHRGVWGLDVLVGSGRDRKYCGRQMQTFADSTVLNENELAAFDEAVSLDGFCLTDNGMAFYVSKSAIDPYEMTDIYTEEFTWDELEGMFNKPELY